MLSSRNRISAAGFYSDPPFAPHQLLAWKRVFSNLFEKISCRICLLVNLQSKIGRLPTITR
jgi:hypothetical protein